MISRILSDYISFFLLSFRWIGAILKKWTAKSERWYNNKKGEKHMENTKYTEEFKQSIVSLYESGKKQYADMQRIWNEQFHAA